MPLLALPALTKGGALAVKALKARRGFQLASKAQTPEARAKRAEALKKGFAWVKKQAGRIESVKKTERGYQVTGDGFTGNTASGKFDFTTGGASEDQQASKMPVIPIVAGVLLLMLLKK